MGLAHPFPGAEHLILRRVPWLQGKVSFSKISKDKGRDIFIINTSHSMFHIAASGENAAAKALGYFLKNYCARSSSHMGDNLAPVAKFPVIDHPVKVVSSSDIRYALNYCTVNYTMSFYEWSDWEHELDWMALNGVNLMLAPVGAEAVWQKTLERIGCSQDEILQFIPGPAYTAWWLMGNLEGWGGPVSQEIINQQCDLEKKILKRMKELGIQPVMQGFYGMVPPTLSNKGFDLLDQGMWAGGFNRPPMIKQVDVFKKLAHIYYEEMKKIYGGDLHFFAGDPFHEGGKSSGIDLADYGNLIQSVMQEYYPSSIWVLQGWQQNPSSQLLSRLDKSKVLVQELFGENTDNWYQRKAYEGTPFIWCSVNNFGEKSGLYGKLQRFANEVFRAQQSEFSPFLRGVGIMPEGLHNNPVVYEFVLDIAWHQEKVIASDWIKSYVNARYGTSNQKILDAWQIFLNTVYSSFDQYQEGPSESVFCARPSLKIRSASSWGTRVRNYNTDSFKTAVKLFVSVSDEMKSSQTYLIDEIDFVRQVISNEGEKVYNKMVASYEQRDLAEFDRQSDSFLLLIKMQDSLLSMNEHFCLNTWLKQALSFGKNQEDQTLALLNAKKQITYWGNDDPKTDLHDYANKEWIGLMLYYYYPRWEMFIRYCSGKLKNEEITAPDYFSFEYVWVRQPNLYPPKEISETQLQSIIRRVFNSSH